MQTCSNFTHKKMGCGSLGLNIIVSIQITGLRNTVNLKVLMKCLDPSEFKTTSISKSNEAIFKLLKMEKGKLGLRNSCVCEIYIKSKPLETCLFH